MAHVALGLSTDIVDVVERMHGSISRAPLPFGRLESDRARGLSGLIYRGLHNVFDLGELGLIFASRSLATDANADETHWLSVQAALNGVIGDKLAARHSPLAVRFQLINAPSQPIAPEYQLIFLHGLCMSDVGWATPASQRFIDWATKTKNAQTSFLRYNSGLRISANGEKLSQLLEDHTELPLILVGHSMGGLLIRSALSAAKRRGHRWPQRLQHAAMLGSPHHGAPLERLGNHANRLLKFSPYTRPLGRLGNLRSVGIKDLRFGNLDKSDWQQVTDPDHTKDTRQPRPLPSSNTRFLLMAASRSQTLDALTPEQGKDDLLVPIGSALGLSSPNVPAITAKHLTRKVFDNMNHLDLLTDERVFDYLKNWINAS